MTHDPLCPSLLCDESCPGDLDDGHWCLCDLISKVIERERDRSVKLVEAIVEAIIGRLPKPKKEDSAA